MSEVYTDAEREIILQAKKKALKLLEYADRTEKQLRDKLKEGEFPPFAVDEAVEYVRSYHYIDDARFAENYILSRVNRKSCLEIKYELREKGVADELIEQAIEEQEIDESLTVYRLFLKKYASKDLSDPSVYQKAFRYFSSHGFGYADIRKALQEAVDESADEY